MNIERCWYKDVCTQECKSVCIRYNEMLSLLEQSRLPESKWFPATLYPDDCDYEAFKQLAYTKQFITSFVEDGRNLYIYSTKTGNGKTSWSIKLMLKYFNNIWAGNGFKCRGLFIHVPTFLTRLKNFEDKDEQFLELKRLLPVVDLVVWDDVAGSGLSAYDHTQLLTYIDQRVLESKANIYTGNLNGTELEKSLGTRLSSRIYNSSEIIELKGKDNR